MGDLDTEQIYKVIATAGLYLRKGPIKSETNTIFLMVDGTIVTREGDEVRTGSNHQWYKVRFIDENRDIVGWAAIDYLELQYPIGVSGEPPIDNNPPPPPVDPPEDGTPVSSTPPTNPLRPEVAAVTNVYYNKKRKLVCAYLRSIPSDVTNGAVKYTHSVDRRTSIQYWNIAAAPNSKIKP